MDWNRGLGGAGTEGGLAVSLEEEGMDRVEDETEKRVGLTHCLIPHKHQLPVYLRPDQDTKGQE